MSSIVLACRASSLDPLLLLFGHSAKERKGFSKAINDTYWARSKFLLELHVLDDKVLGLWMIKNQEHLKVDFRRLNFVSSIVFLGNCQQLHMWNGTPLLPSATVVGGCGGVHPPRQTSTSYADTPLGRHTLPRADYPDTHPEAATAADGTHPTGMHSYCFVILSVKVKQAAALLAFGWLNMNAYKMV